MSIIQTTLKCPCGREIQMVVPGERWNDSIRSVAAASKWKVCEDYAQPPGPSVDGYCPNCHYSEPRPGEVRGMMMHVGNP